MAKFHNCSASFWKIARTSAVGEAIFVALAEPEQEESVDGGKEEHLALCLCLEP